MDPINALAWIFIGVFLITAIITLGGILENFKFIEVKKEYLKLLVPAFLFRKRMIRYQIYTITGILESDITIIG